MLKNTKAIACHLRALDCLEHQVKPLTLIPSVCQLCSRGASNHLHTHDLMLTLNVQSRKGKQGIIPDI